MQKLIEIQIQNKNNKHTQTQIQMQMQIQIHIQTQIGYREPRCSAVADTCIAMMGKVSRFYLGKTSFNMKTLRQASTLKTLRQALTLKTLLKKDYKLIYNLFASSFLNAQFIFDSVQVALGGVNFQLETLLSCD